ncbi:MAG: DRTGG domain-containing protein [Nitrospirota bacterium]
MILKDITEALKAEVVVNPADINIQVQCGCSADLMSDVLFYCTSNSILITGLTQRHVVRTAEIIGIKGIVFVQNKKPDKETIELAKEKKIPLFITPFCMYTASGKLYEAGLRGCPKQ